MKFQFTLPKKAVAEITFCEGEATKVVEDTKGNTLIKIGVGSSNDVTRRKLFTLIRKAVRTARENKLGAIRLSAHDLRFKKLDDISDQELGRILAENALMANYEFTKYKSGAKKYHGIDTMHIEGASAAFKAGVHSGTIVGNETNFARDLANTPGGDMTPRTLATAAMAAAKGTAMTVKILNKKDIEKLKMGLVLGVAQGSSEEPKFIIMEYWGAGKTSKQKPIVFVGKGVTFDTGGINLKPETGIFGMHHDMAGGGAVIAAIAAIAKMKLKKNVVAVVPAVENMPSGTAYRPGDVLVSMSGKTVEVLNTDAEGRLILGDALTYVERYNARLVVDVATLTGAALVALGQRASAVLTRDEKIERTLRDLGEVSGEYVWPLPLWKEYEADIKGTFADIANLAQGNARYGGTINGGTFLAQFATKYPWAHIDMAPRMESIPEDNLAKGATGAPVRLLVRLAEEY